MDRTSCDNLSNWGKTGKLVLEALACMREVIRKRGGGPLIKVVCRAYFRFFSLGSTAGDKRKQAINLFNSIWDIIFFKFHA